MDKLVLIWLLCLNIAAFICMFADKRFAVHGLRRIPERTLLLLALAGGSLGALSGMLLFRHKTRHPRFYIGLPVIFILHLAAAYYLLCV